MRSILAAAFAILACLSVGGCAAPKRSSIRYSPPSFIPVREKLSDAQTLAVAEAAAAVAAQTALARARTLAPQIPDLQEAIAEASGQVNHLLEVNANLQKSLKEAGEKITSVELVAKNQTLLLNDAITEKNDAITERDEAVGKYHKLKFLVCLLAAALVSFIAVRLGALKLISRLALLGPWGIAGAAALAVAIPGGVFTFLWVAEPWEWLPFF